MTERSSRLPWCLVAAIAATLLLVVIAMWFMRTAPDAEPPALRVGAAISLRPALEEIAARFEQETGNPVELSFGSSGQIMGQIRSGAPIDLFISAAQQQVDQLAAEGLVDEDSRRVIARNTLVLVVPTDAVDVPESFAGLAGPGVKRLAIGEPRTVPAGQYAQHVLERLGLAEALRGRLVHGTNVRQVLSYVERNEVTAGIVYRTDALTSPRTVRQVATADPAWHHAIEYPAVIVTAARDRAAARAFLEYLKGPEAKKVFQERGFIVEGG